MSCLSPLLLSDAKINNLECNRRCLALCASDALFGDVDILDCLCLYDKILSSQPPPNALSTEKMSSAITLEEVAVRSRRVVGAIKEGLNKGKVGEAFEARSDDIVGVHFL